MPALNSIERLGVLDLLNRMEDALSRESLEESRRRNVVHGWSCEHWLGERDGQLVSYAQLIAGDPPTIEVVGGAMDDDLRRSVLRLHPVVDWWLRDVSVATGDVQRELLLMNVALPAPAAEMPTNATLRTFDPTTDEAAWLRQNNAAFANHPEQGAWRSEDLHARTLEPWFDASGFLILEIDGALAASCWTKVHELHPERYGEIYVVSVDPTFQGQGLGRVMVLVGLASLRQRGVTKAMLFVDESNVAARRLYESLGFTTIRRDQLVRLHR